MYFGDKMEIMRQRLFITHDIQSQSRIKIEYMIRSKTDELLHVFLKYGKFLPGLVIRDENGSILPFMSGNDIELLYRTHIKQSTTQEKAILEKELREIKDRKNHLIWISLKNRPLRKGKTLIFTMEYVPQNEDVKNSEMSLMIKKEDFPVYYVLYSPKRFDFKKPKFEIVKDGRIKPVTKLPDHVDVYNSYRSMSLRVGEDVEYEVVLSYSFSASTSSKTLTYVGAAVLSVFPILYLVPFVLGVPIPTLVKTRDIPTGC